ncbi:glycosyltransferase family 1 protein [Trametes coccinea BRFM310]|uniref:Glycosyltransferase family 1 protein n=1 Tax=Trametes coccinea (strain BRFM310) TaxID=1353009 RepID=A0A1Y2IXA6_TRAC3|nr:glycosyltransferase family 1 protein [Trametes coccinea BRFM310]
MTAQLHKHILVCPAHLWGHARPLAILAARMVKLRPVVVTFVAAYNVYERLQAEILSDFHPGEEEAISRIRVIRIDPGAELIDPAVLKANFWTLWTKLCNGEAVPYETANGKQGLVDLKSEPLSAVVIDGITVEIFEAVYEHRKRSPELSKLKIYSWLPASNDYFLAVYRDDKVPAAEALAQQEGISFNDAAHRLWTIPQGRVIRSASLPPVYDYEMEPQALPLPPDLCGRLFIKANRMLENTDGVVIMDAAEFHSEATSAFRKWLAETRRKLYCVGPLLSTGRTGPGYQAKGDAEGIMRFLDEELSARGARAVVYVSFGSVFWPMDNAKLLAALEVLMQQNIPFIMSRPSPLAVFSEESMNKLKAYPNGFISSWVPQRAVLEHPATGWCLMHGGHSTLMECIHTGVPMIVWPVSTDQPANAIYLSEYLDIAYELLEVRHGTGLGKIFRTGFTPTGTVEAVRNELRDVLSRAFSADGEAKRDRIKGLRAKMEEAWTENGIGRRQAEEFLDDASAGAPADMVTSS